VSTASIEAPGELGEHVESESVSSIVDDFTKVGKSGTAVIFRKKAKSSLEGDPDCTDTVNELVLSWLVEDLEITAGTCHADPNDVFEDLLALIVSKTPVLHRPEADYAGAVRQLTEWFLEDVESVARSFELDPPDVLVDAFKLAVSETPLADRMIEVKAELGAVFGEV